MRKCKPKIKLLKDAYALSTGEYYVCTLASICARGRTPKESYDNLQDHFKQLSQFTPTAIQLKRMEALTKGC